MQRSNTLKNKTFELLENIVCAIQSAAKLLISRKFNDYSYMEVNTICIEVNDSSNEDEDIVYAIMQIIVM